MNPMEPFRYEAVRQDVLTLIASGALTPGSKAPSLRRLAARMRVSLSTVSQAYAQLEREGVLEARPKSGFFICQAKRKLPSPIAVPHVSVGPAPLNRAALIRQVLENMALPGVVPLGVARTAEHLLPLVRLNRILGQVLREQGDRVGFYEQVQGNEPLRQQIVLRAMETGTECKVSETLVTSGAMEALHIALRSVTRPGDTVCIAVPAYFCFLQLLENLGLRVIEIPSRPSEGVRPGDLAHVVDSFNVAACVLAPNFNNPDGALTPDEAKAEIVDILARRGVPLIEDDVYGDLHFGPDRPRCCKAFDTKGLVLSCSSFSKTITPGYRVGWLLPGRFLDKALEIKSTLNVCSATPTQMAMAEYLRSGHYHRHLKQLRPAIAAQMETMYSHIGRHFPPGTKATRPLGGSVLWVQLPGNMDSVSFMHKALAKGITVSPGTIFSARDQFGDFIRLSYSAAAEPQLAQAVEVLGKIATEGMS